MSTDVRPSALDLDAENLLPEVYALLADVLSVPEVDSDYARALRTVLDAAWASEQAGFPLTLLPLLACQAAGGNPRQALPVAAAWRALHIAAKLLDDVEDGDVIRMSAVPTDPPRVINLATGFITAAGLALVQLAADGQFWHTLHHDFSRTVLQVAGGQHADLSRRNALDLDGYCQIMAAKSGGFFALAARAGARCATSDPAQIARYDRFGYNVGILIQIADDLDGFRLPVGQGDLAAGQRTLPTLYALAVASPPEQARLERLLAHASADADAEAEAEARQLIAALGAVAYLLAEMMRYRSRALAVLEPGSEADSASEPLRDWLVHLQPPVW